MGKMSIAIRVSHPVPYGTASGVFPNFEKTHALT